jgi:hypothetical protein
LSALELVKKSQPQVEDGASRASEDGAPRAAVVAVKKGAPKATAFAAKELQNYLQKITGASLALVEIEDGAGPSLQALTTKAGVVSVGENKLMEELGLSSAQMEPDAFRIVCRGKALAIFGRDDPEVDPAKWQSVGSAGTLYGVYSFLESLGVRWFFPGEIGEVVPKRETVEVPDNTDIASAPYFPFRLAQPPLETPEANLWARRVGLGAALHPAATCHSFTSWHRKYAKTNPEYFALHGDKRIDYICFYGKGVREQMIQDAREYFRRADPKKFPYFTVMENDGAPGPCECPECQRRLTRDEGWYGLMSDYVAEAAVDVARAVKDEFPDRGVCIGAYNEYTRPPLRVRFDHAHRPELVEGKELPANVGVQIFRHRQQIWSEEARKNIYAVVVGWLALKPKTISFWDYYNFDCWSGARWLGVPAVTTRFIAEDIKRLKELSQQSKTKFLGELTFCDGRVKAHHPERVWWLGLDIYLTGKFLWNPDLNREELLKDFYGKFFGPAAAPMEKFYSRAEDVWVNGDHGGRNFYCAKPKVAPKATDAGSLEEMRKTSYISADPWKCLFTPPVLKELAQYLTEAQTLAKDPPYRERVEMVSKGFALTLSRAAAAK